MNELAIYIYSPPIYPEVKTHYLPVRQAVADGVCGLGSMGSKSMALQTVSLEYNGRVRRPRIACRQSCPTAVAFWEGEGGCSTSGGRGSRGSRGSRRGQQEGGAAPAAAEAVAPQTPSRGSRRGGGRWVDWGECNSCGAIIKQLRAFSHGHYSPVRRSVEPSILTPSRPIRKRRRRETFSLD